MTLVKINEKITTNSEPSNPEDFVSKACLDTNLSIIRGHISIKEKNNDEIELHSNKKSEVEFLFEKAVKTTVQKLHDKGLFDSYDNADGVLKDYLLTKVNERRRPDLDPLNDNVIQ